MEGVTAANTVRNADPSDPGSDLGSDLVLALGLADAAAAVTLARFGDRLPVELKDDDTPVTEVDRAAERAIRAILADRAPADGILGEEEGHRPGADGRTWVIDPVDGTKLFAEGIPLWTTLIALTVDGEPVLGVADAPALGVRYHATRDGDPEKLGVVRPRDDEAGIVASADNVVERLAEGDAVAAGERRGLTALVPAERSDDVAMPRGEVGEGARRAR